MAFHRPFAFTRRLSISTAKAWEMDQQNQRSDHVCGTVLQRNMKCTVTQQFCIVGNAYPLNLSRFYGLEAHLKCTKQRIYPEYGETQNEWQYEHPWSGLLGIEEFLKFFIYSSPLEKLPGAKPLRVIFCFVTITQIYISLYPAPNQRNPAHPGSPLSHPYHPEAHCSG